MFRWLLSLCLFAMLSASLVAQVPPEKMLSTMSAGPGLQVELFASEPMVINPTAMDVDEQGRVWVSEAVNYRRKNFNRPILRPEGDRIQVLIDETGAGKATKAVTFYQGPELYGPLSVLVIPQVKDGKAKGYRVLAAQSPDILEFTDADGDLKADGPPKKFLTGFGGFDHDHGVHGLHMGPDGKLYFTVGDSGVTGLQSADGKGKKYVSNTTDVQKGTVWRCDLQGNNLELIAHNFRNNYEACVDSFGEIWCSDNDDDGNQQTRICFVMPGGNYGYGPRGPGQTHWHEEQPGIVHKTLRTGFGSPCGIQFYEGTTLPAQYHNTLMHCDAGPREVRAFTRKPKGAGYELDKTNMLTSTDGWFRPVDVCTAPDGSVFVADWYDPGVGGHGMGDHTRGRVYRLSPAGSVGYKVPEVKLGTSEERNQLLGSPNIASRSLSHVNNQSMTFIDTVDDLHLISSSPVATNSHMRAAWAAQNRMLAGPSEGEKPNPQTAMKLRDISRDVSKLPPDLSGASMVRLTSKLIGSNTYPVSMANIFSKAELPVKNVYRELLISMRSVDADEMKKHFYQFATYYDGQDQVYRAALNIACGTDPVRRDAILADFEKHFPEWNDKVADLVWELRPKSMLPKMGQLLLSDKITPVQKARIVDILAVNDSPEAGKTLLTLLDGNASPEVKASAVNNLKLFLPTKWAELKKGDEVKKAIKQLFTSKQQFFAMQLAVAAPECCDLNDIQKTAKDANLHPEVRREAVVTCGKIRNVELTKFLTTLASDKDLGSVAINALGNHVSGQGSDEISKLALGTLEGMLAGDSSTELKKTAVEALAGTRAGTGWLLKQKEAGKLPENLTADAGRLLRNSPFQGERNKAMILFPAHGKLNPKNLPSPAILATKKGDAANGQKLMAASMKGESQCLKCHMVSGQGGQIGPDLSMIGKKGSRENLFESILNPSKAIADQYVTWKVDTADGQVISGLLISETETNLTLRDANGKDYVVATKDVDKKSKLLTSIMPEGLAATLTEEELIDIVEYMTQLQTASLTPDSWLIAGPFPGASMEAALATDHKPTDFKLVKLTNAYMDLAQLHGDKAKNSASYAMKEIESTVGQDATILLGVDDGAKLWVNGVEVFETKDTKAATPEQHSVKVKLKPGVNKVMLKVANGNNPHGFYFTITSNEPLKAK
jgi:putative membrane-bound dehydrogenase-like protein